MKTIQQGYEWLAHEIVSQYKSGDFSKMEVSGVDGQNRRFKATIDPDKIKDDWKFECKLFVDLPQDEQANVGMAVQTTEAELLSKNEARDRYHLSRDPDLTQDKIDREKAEGITGFMLRKIESLLREDGDEEGAEIIRSYIENQMAQENQKGVASQPGGTRSVRPSGSTSATVPDASKVTDYLRRYGASAQ